MAESVIFAQQTLAGFADGGLIMSPAPFVPVEGEIYRVAWDGAEHICVCAVDPNMWGVPAISDVVLDAEGNPVSGTFAIVYYTAEELEAEADTMVLYSLDTTTTEHTVGVYQIATTAIIEDGSFTSVLDAEFGYCYSTATEAGLFEAEKQYAIVWDGAAYLCTAQDASAVMEGADCLIGNGTAFGLEGNGEPFIIGLTTEGVILFVCLTDTVETEHTVSLYRVEESSDSGGGTEEPEESYDDNDVSVKSYSQEDVIFRDVPKIWLKKTGSSDEAPVLVPFTFGEVVEGVQIQLDFSEGDQVIAVPEGQLVKEATIVKPEGLVPENIRQGAEIAGVPGEYTPETQEQEVALFMPEDDQVVLPTDGKFLSKVTIKKPDTLKPENIAKDVEIGGVVGTHEGGDLSITYMNEDGSETLFERPIMYGDTAGDVVALGLMATPTKESTAQYSYAHAGWSDEPNGGLNEDALKDVTEDKVVYANFAAILRHYTINFYDEDGTLIEAQSVAYGEMPSCTPEKDGFTFDGWRPAVAAVTGDADYYAIWSVSENVLYSGTCGDAATWVLYDTGELRISGTGKMTQFAGKQSMPWYSYRSLVKSVVVEEGITTIGCYSFYEHTNLVEASLPESLTMISYDAFFGCTALTSITIPTAAAVTTIAARAFQKCTALVNVDLGGTQKIGQSCFAGCTALTSITIPASVTYINNLVFNGLTNLTSITFEVTSGWYRTTTYNATSGGTAISSSYLANKTTAAKYLTSTYTTYYWYRS